MNDRLRSPVRPIVAALAIAALVATGALAVLRAPNAAPARAQEADLIVCRTLVTCTHSTVQSALDAAAAGQTVRVLPGVYTETVTLKAGVRLTGTPGVTVLNGDGSGPVVTADDPAMGPDTELRGFVITGGQAERGAGVYIDGGAAPTLGLLVVQRNRGAGRSSSQGGGLWIGGGGTPAVERTTFISNTAAFGGGVYVDGAAAELHGSVFSLNSATVSGGALYLNESSAQVISATFNVNIAVASGGAVYARGGAPLLERGVLFPSNAASLAGGGIALDGGTATVRHTTVVSNAAGTVGGGIAVFGAAEPMLHDVLVARNRALGSGSGMSYQGAGGQLTFATVVDNTAGAGEGIDLRQAETAPRIGHSIVARNGYGIRGPEGLPAGRAPDPAIEHTDVWGNTQGDLVGVNISEQAQTDGNFSADPLLVAGPLGDYYLAQTAAGQSGQSPAVDRSPLGAAEAGLDARTTRVDAVTDSGPADLGYHYRAVAAPQPSVTPPVTPRPTATPGGPTPTARPTRAPGFPGDTAVGVETSSELVTEGQTVEVELVLEPGEERWLALASEMHPRRGRRSFRGDVSVPAHDERCRAGRLGFDNRCIRPTRPRLRLNSGGQPVPVGLTGFELTLSYDPVRLSFADARVGPLLGSTGRGVESSPPRVLDGQVTLDARLAPGGTGPLPWGRGVLAVVELQAAAVGEARLALERAALRDRRGSLVEVEGGATLVRVGPPTTDEPATIYLPFAWQDG